MGFYFSDSAIQAIARDTRRNDKEVSFERGQQDGKRLMKAAVLDLIRSAGQGFRRAENEENAVAAGVRALLSRLIIQVEQLDE